MNELKLIKALAEIQNMCIGKITMGYSLDEMHIGELIADATGMTNPQLNEYVAELTLTHPTERKAE